jgi:hypothetical protein
MIQHNLMDLLQLEKVRQAINKYPHVYVGLIPFTREITCDEDWSGNDYIPYGSTLLTTLGHDVYKWKGLHFDLTKFNYEASLQNRDDMLNSNVLRLDDAITYLGSMNISDIVFTRPSEDLKQFSGQVIEAGECHDWFKSMMECQTSGSYKLEPDTKVIVCGPQNILAEFRWFIVGGKVVSGSMYRAHNQLNSQRCIEKELIDEAQTIADKWLPDPCCVMDLALTDYGMKVIEFNCINASGFYDNDIPAIFKALWEYHC